jgi:hypothetical protein
VLREVTRCRPYTQCVNSFVSAPQHPAGSWAHQMYLPARVAPHGLIGLPAVLGRSVVRDPALHSIARVRAEE